MLSENTSITARQMLEFWEKVENGDIDSLKFQKFIDHCNLNKFLNGCLKLISGCFIIKALDGKETFNNANDIFDIIHSDSKEIRIDLPGEKSAEIKVAVYKLVQPGRFSDIFGAREGVQNYCLTPAQINEFIRSHYQELQIRVGGTFFLSHLNSIYFIAEVSSGIYANSSKLALHIRPYSHSYAWKSSRPRRIVIPVH